MLLKLYYSYEEKALLWDERQVSVALFLNNSTGRSGAANLTSRRQVASRGLRRPMGERNAHQNVQNEKVRKLESKSAAAAIFTGFLGLFWVWAT